MSVTTYTGAEVIRRGEEIYEHDLREKIEGEHRGEFLVLDVETGDYEIDVDEMKALKRAIDKNPGPHHYIKRIGYTTAHRSSGRGGTAHSATHLTLNT